MPAELQPPAGPSNARVAVSAIVELEYALFAIPSAYEPGAKCGRLPELLQPATELSEAVASFWGDGYNEWAEMLLFAHRSGTLLDDRPVRFFAGLHRVMQEEFAVPELPSEPMEVRGILEARLQQLRSSADFRARYESLLHEVWAVLETYWEREGHANAQRMASALRERLAVRPEVAPLLPKHHFALREQFVPLVERSLRREEVVLVPLALAGVGVLFFALPGALVIAFGPDAESGPQAAREKAAEAAASFKVLSDPTRLAILKTLQGGCTMTVTDIARLYELSQPTVSVHMKALRQAGLVEAERQDGRTLYGASREKTRAFIAAATDQI